MRRLHWTLTALAAGVSLHLAFAQEPAPQPVIPRVPLATARDRAEVLHTVHL